MKWETTLSLLGYRVLFYNILFAVGFIQCENCAVTSSVFQRRLKNTALVHNLQFHTVFVNSHLAG